MSQGDHLSTLPCALETELSRDGRNRLEECLISSDIRLHNGRRDRKRMGERRRCRLERNGCVQRDGSQNQPDYPGEKCAPHNLCGNHCRWPQEDCQLAEKRVCLCSIRRCANSTRQGSTPSGKIHPHFRALPTSADHTEGSAAGLGALTHIQQSEVSLR